MADRSGLERSSSGRLANGLLEALRREILDGRLLPGQRLVEREIAERFAVSRTPVREAIHRLEMDGLVESTGNGAAVAAVDSGQLSDLCTVRESLEGLAARLAASSASELEISALHVVCSSAKEAVEHDDVIRQVELNHVFHETIWHASRNRYLLRQLRLIRDLVERRQATTLRTGDRQRRSLVEHEKIVEAIVLRDADAAAAAAQEHFRQAMLIRLFNLRA